MRAGQPIVAIVMATHNGAHHLAAQLQSFATQKLRPSDLLVGDDASTDGTRDILLDFAQAYPELRLHLTDGPGQGAAANFLTQIAALPDCLPEGVDFLAISDQDDVWLPEKLARAAEALQVFPDHQPVLYLGTTLVCDEDLGNPRCSPIPRKPAGFAHALVQNIAGGNTMVANRAGAALLAAAAREAGQTVVHDWWAYQLVTGAGGQVVFDTIPGLYYRQHRGNLIGANDGAKAKLTRLRMLLAGDFKRWNRMNIAALQRSAHRFTPENRALLAGFATLCDAGLLGRLSGLYRLGLYRQGRTGQASLWLAALMGRL